MAKERLVHLTTTAPDQWPACGRAAGLTTRYRARVTCTKCLACAYRPDRQDYAVKLAHAVADFQDASDLHVWYEDGCQQFLVDGILYDGTRSRTFVVRFDARGIAYIPDGAVCRYYWIQCDRRASGTTHYQRGKLDQYNGEWIGIPS